MMEPLISIVLAGYGRIVEPGELLRGELQIDAVDPDELESLELSVLWYTEGKGDEDLGIHYFQRIAADGPNRSSLHELRKFQTVMPASPLSYDGVILRLRWCVRLRVFLTRGRSYVADKIFQLGNLPSATPIRPATITTTANDRPAETITPKLDPEAAPESPTDTAERRSRIAALE